MIDSNAKPKKNLMKMKNSKFLKGPGPGPGAGPGSDRAGAVIRKT